MSTLAFKGMFRETAYPFVPFTVETAYMLTDNFYGRSSIVLGASTCGHSVIIKGGLGRPEARNCNTSQREISIIATIHQLIRIHHHMQTINVTWIIHAVRILSQLHMVMIYQTTCALCQNGMIDRRDDDEPLLRNQRRREFHKVQKLHRVSSSCSYSYRNSHLDPRHFKIQPTRLSSPRYVLPA